MKASGRRRRGDPPRYLSLLIDLASHLEFLSSQRSVDFKAKCVRRIEKFVDMHDRSGHLN
jgi:hypothetical protein